MNTVAQVIEDLAIVIEGDGWIGGGIEDARVRLSFLRGDEARAAMRLLGAISDRLDEIDMDLDDAA